MKVMLSFECMSRSTWRDSTSWGGIDVAVDSLNKSERERDQVGVTRGSCAFLARRMFEGLISSGGERSEERRMQQGDVNVLENKVFSLPVVLSIITTKSGVDDP